MKYKTQKATQIYTTESELNNFIQDVIIESLYSKKIKVNDYIKYIKDFDEEQMNVLNKMCEDVIRNNAVEYINNINNREVVLYNGNEIDALIYETVVIMNDKGYTTLNSCQGHSYNSLIGLYLMFDINRRGLPDISDLEEFAYDRNKKFGIVILRYKPTVKDVLKANLDVEEAIKYANLKLLNWAKKL